MEQKLISIGILYNKLKSCAGDDSKWILFNNFFYFNCNYGIEPFQMYLELHIK